MAAIAVATVVPTAAFARPKIPVLQQVTHSTMGNIENVGMRLEDGSGISFVSNSDVFGPGSEPGQFEVFYYKTDTGELIQVTNTPGGESYEASRPSDRLRQADRPSMVTFVSDGDFDAGRDNSDGNIEIFAWETDTGVFRQLTDTQAPTINIHPFVSDSAKCIVFSSTANFANNDGNEFGNPGRNHSNPDGSLEVFQYSLHDRGMYPYNGIMSQISNGPAGSISASPVAGGYWFPRQCQSTAYISNYAQLGDGSVGDHIYLYTRFSGKLERMESTAKLPRGIPDGDYLFPHISGASPFARGPYVVFTTDADMLANDSVGLNLYRYRVFHPQVNQLTDVVDGNVLHPQISDGGGRVVFQSTAEHFVKLAKNTDLTLPVNGDHNNEIFLLRGRRRLKQITVSSGCENRRPTLQDDATAFAFTSDCDLIPGNNPTGAVQLFHYKQVKKKDPILLPGACKVEDGCCSQDNGCLVIPKGPQKRHNQRNCIDKNQKACLN
ncbi:MAG: hypothetical protein ACI8TX_002316 [Hyphomicrobiaceae bacterium]|jgi:hypothetical protein